MSPLATPGVSVRVTALPEMATELTVWGVPSVPMLKAPAAGAVVFNASS